MSQLSGKLTDAGHALISQKITQNADLNLTEFVFANVSGLDPNTPPDSYNQSIPTSDIVHQQAVTKTGYIDNDTVVYSIVLNSTIGDFDFNWVGLLDETGALVILKYIPTQFKRGNVAGEGNNLNRNFALKFTGAATVTTISIPAESWQYDTTQEFISLNQKVDDLESSLFYSATKNYTPGQWVFASNTMRYICKQANGPNTSVENPISEDEFWCSDEKYFFDLENPIGRVIYSSSPDNPNQYHGDWKRIAEGRFIVGLTDSDADFNVANKKGGTKTHSHSNGTLKANHNHSVSNLGWGSVQSGNQLPEPTADGRLITGSGLSENSEELESLAHSGNGIVTSTANADVSGSTSSASSIPPYETLYIWERVA